MRDTKNAHEYLVGTSETKRHLRWPGNRLEDNINVYLKQIKLEGISKFQPTHEFDK
jgi:hypothetical protein